MSLCYLVYSFLALFFLDRSWKEIKNFFRKKHKHLYVRCLAVLLLIQFFIQREKRQWMTRERRGKLNCRPPTVAFRPGKRKSTWSHVALLLEDRIKQNSSVFLLSAAKRMVPLPTVAEERERHHSVATMTNIQSSKEQNRKFSWMRRSTRWTLIADDVKVLKIRTLFHWLYNISEHEIAPLPLWIPPHWVTVYRTCAAWYSHHCYWEFNVNIPTLNCIRTSMWY